MKTKLTFLICLILVTALSACTPNRPAGNTSDQYEGVFVLHILFSFSNEQAGYINANTTEEMTEEELTEMYDSLAPDVVKNNGVSERAVFGEDGIYEEISDALDGLTGQAAITAFEEFIDIYNDDSGMLAYPDGYYVELEGETYFVSQFTNLARALYNSDNPTGSIGNAYVDGKLAYSTSQYGVHILMIKSLKSAK